MKKITLEISDEAHMELLKIQLEEKLKNNKLTIAQTAAKVIEEAVKEKKAEK
ncbi:hypothetical protein [Sphingobacterium siyangense]|uniref:hypothetical protein n=1 Tax=Sphingobacterium siyangense TaxID=459529 RepID=UPI003DA5D2A2